MSDEVIRIDLDGVLRQRLPRHYRYIPGFLIRAAERFIRQDGLNRLLESNAGRTGAEFCRGMLSDLDISCDIIGEENLPGVADCRKLFVCNHPLGALDGVIFIDYIARRYGEPLYFVVNDLLMAVKPLTPVFLPINKHGRQSRDAAAAIEEAFAGTRPIIMFPAGMVSRRKGRVITDLRWHTMFVNHAIKYNRDIVPAFFEGTNTDFFYRCARFWERLGIKFNIEMLRLPAEMFHSCGKRYRLYFGKTILVSELRGGHEARTTAEAIRRIVYDLPEQ